MYYNMFWWAHFNVNLYFLLPQELPSYSSRVGVAKLLLELEENDVRYFLRLKLNPL